MNKIKSQHKTTTKNDKQNAGSDTLNIKECEHQEALERKQMKP